MINSILLTGSGGFIGSNLKNYLKAEFDILAPRSNELNLIDKTQVKKFFETNNADIIIHCATVGGARGVQDKETTVDDNLAMVNNIIAYKKPNTRVILFGSGAMYGKARNLHKVSETEIGNYVPDDLYGKSKMLIAEHIKTRQDVLCLNIFACYGYGEKESRFPSYAINCALENKDIIINQNVIFDYLWVEDMQRIVTHFIHNIPSSNIINITPTESVSLLEIAEIVKAIENKNIDIKILNPKMNNEYTGSNRRLLTEIPDIRFTKIADGLEKLYNYKKVNLTTV